MANAISINHEAAKELLKVFGNVNLEFYPTDDQIKDATKVIKKYDFFETHLILKS